VAAVQELDP